MSNVLLIDDEPRFCQANAELLRHQGHQVTTANCLAAARELLGRSEPDVVLLDLMLPDGNGLELLAEFDAEWQGLVVVITGHPSIKNHIRDLAGPDVTYLTKPVDAEEIVRLVDDRDGPRELGDHDSCRHFGALIGESEVMQRVYEDIEKFGPTEATVLIEGESGTGKELVASALHGTSGRRGQFVPTNCGALAHELVASELFGHEKGSFTGATRRHTGVFERASGGTLFLDEISEMPNDMQTFLLRSLESGEIVRVGGENRTKVDTRLLAATNRRLTEAVGDGSLREDLYYRLSEFVISLPPLRERIEDVDLLVASFVADLNQRYDRERHASEPFLERCRTYHWPGNVRELKHVVHRAYLLADETSGELSGEHGFDAPIAFEQSPMGVAPGRAIRDVERELIYKTLEHFRGDKKAAAETLGISLKTLYNRLNEYGRQQDGNRDDGEGGA